MVGNHVEFKGNFLEEVLVCNRLLWQLTDIIFLIKNTVYFYGLSKNSEKRLLFSSFPSEWNESFPTGQVFMKFDI